jgi:hypothetical protein
VSLVHVMQQRGDGMLAGKVLIHRREYLRSVHRWRMRISIRQDSEAAAQAAITEGVDLPYEPAALLDEWDYSISWPLPYEVAVCQVQAAVAELVPHERPVLDAAIDIYAVKGGAR